MSDDSTRDGAADAGPDIAPDEGMLRQIIDALDAGVMVADTSGNLVVSNASAIRMVGMQVATLTADGARPWAENHGFFFPDQTTPMPMEEMPMARALGGASVERVPMFLRNPEIPDGAFVSVDARPLVDASGVRVGAIAVLRVGAIAVLRDVTEYYRMEEALSDAFDAGRVEVLDTMLHNVGNAINSVSIGLGSLRNLSRDNTALRRLQALAEALEANRDDLPRYLSEDAQGRLVLPFVTGLAEDFEALADQWQLAAERISRSVDYIVDVLRTQRQTGHERRVVKDVTLEEAIRKAIDVLDAGLSGLGIAMHVDCDDGERVIRVDESRFHQMLVNLLKNAMEAIEARARTGALEEPRIDVRAAVADGSLHLEVADNGVGISADQLGEVLEPGFTTKEQGTGLGLASAASYVASAGGAIEPSSAGAGQGATIRVWLRLPDNELGVTSHDTPPPPLPADPT